MSSKAPTHCLVRTNEVIQNDPQMRTYPQAKLYRLPEGMEIATAKGKLIQFGEDPQHQSMRNFIDHDHAVAKIVEMADRDWAVTSGEDPSAKDFIEKSKGYQANIREDGDGSRRIIPANEAGTLSKPILKQ